MPTYQSRRRLPIRPTTRPVPGAIASRQPRPAQTATQNLVSQAGSGPTQAAQIQGGLIPQYQAQQNVSQQFRQAQANPAQYTPGGSFDRTPTGNMPAGGWNDTPSPGLSPEQREAMFARLGVNTPQVQAPASPSTTEPGGAYHRSVAQVSPGRAKRMTESGLADTPRGQELLFYDQAVYPNPQQPNGDPLKMIQQSPYLQRAVPPGMVQQLMQQDAQRSTEGIVQQAQQNVASRGGTRQLGDIYDQAHEEALRERMEQNGASAMQDRSRRIMGQLDRPRQTLDGAAALQGRLTATGQPYPTTLDQGPRQRAFQPEAGTVGQSTVTIDPQTGRAIVQGNMDPRRLNVLGVRDVPVYEQVGDYGSRQVGTRRDDSAIQGRQAFNRQRQENELFARRLGQAGLYAPGDPAPTGGDMATYRPGLAALRADDNRFRDMLRNRTLQRQGRNLSPQAQEVQNQGNTGPDLDAQWGDYVGQQQNMYLQTRPDMSPDEVRRQSELDANRRFPGASMAQGQTQQGTLGTSTDPVQAQQRLSNQDSQGNQINQADSYHSVLSVLNAGADESVESIARKIVNRQRSREPLSVDHLKKLQQFLKDRRSADPDSFPGMDRGWFQSTASLPRYLLDELINGGDVTQAVANAERRLNADAGRAPVPPILRPTGAYQPIPRS